MRRTQSEVTSRRVKRRIGTPSTTTGCGQASHRVRIHAETGTSLRELELPSLGSVNRNEGDGVISGVSGS
jgi:hypothetical protein